MLERDTTNLDNYSKFKFSSQVGKNSVHAAFPPSPHAKLCRVKDFEILRIMI